MCLRLECTPAFLAVPGYQSWDRYRRGVEELAAAIGLLCHHHRRCARPMCRTNLGCGLLLGSALPCSAIDVNQAARLSVDGIKGLGPPPKNPPGAPEAPSGTGMI